MLVQGALQQAVDLQLQQTSSLLPHRAAAQASSMLALLQDEQWQKSQSPVLQDSREQAAFAVAEHMMKAAQHALQEAAVLPGAGAELQGSIEQHLLLAVGKVGSNAGHSVQHKWGARCHAAWYSVWAAR